MVPRTVCHSSWHQLSTHLGVFICCEQLPEGKGGGSPEPPYQGQAACRLGRALPTKLSTQ